MALDITAIEAAITEIQTSGQSVSVDGMSYSAANLTDLIKLRDTARADTMRTNGSRPLFRGFDFTNMGY